MIDKNYFLTRLRNGEHIDTIGQSVADMMNEAVAEYDAMCAVQEQENAKRELMRELVDTMRELAVLEGADPDDLSVDDEDIEELVESFSALFKTFSAVKQITQTAMSKAKTNKSDDEILHDFLKNIFQ